MNTPTWFCLEVAVNALDSEAISDLLLELGASSITINDAAEQPIFEPPPQTIALWEQLWVAGLFPAETNFTQLLQALQQHSTILDYRFSLVEDKDWVNAWREHFKPLNFGKLWICPSDYVLDEATTDSKPIVVRLDPGLAFGTGNHPTTALCLAWLAQSLPVNAALMDYGCGSGILAIAAAKLGANPIWAIDYDEQALQATAVNASNNQIPLENFHILLPDVVPDIKVDVLIANILANPLKELASRFCNHLKADGQLILSGILQSQVDELIKNYKNVINFSEPMQREGWILLAGRKKR